MRGVPQSRRARLALLLLAAAALRLLFFTGLALGDDVFYSTAAIALGEGHGWPPLPLHWHTRLAITAPTAAALAAFGWHPMVFVWLPFAVSLVGVWLCFHVTDRVVGERAAWIAAILYAGFPLEVIFSTHLFPDLVVGTAAALACWLWYDGLRRDSAAALAGAGAAFSVAYLSRETALMLWPVFVVLWICSGRLWRPRVIWVALLPLCVVVAESGAYASATGDPLYRWRAIVNQVHPLGAPAVAPVTQAAAQAPAAPSIEPPPVQEFVAPPASARPFWLGPYPGYWKNPLRMMATSHEFGLVYVIAMPLAIVALWRQPERRWVALWLLVGFVWLYYGTMVPTRWRPLFYDPRYAAPFTIAALLLIAAHLATWARPMRIVAIGVLTATNLAAISMDQRDTPLTAHRAFLDSAYSADAALEPFEYFGARWVRGLRTPVDFGCASDVGRPSVVQLLPTLPGTDCAPAAARRYFVFSAERRPELAGRMEAAGWRRVADIVGTSAPARRWLAKGIRHVFPQSTRFNGIDQPGRLVVFENPRDAGGSVRASP